MGLAIDCGRKKKMRPRPIKPVEHARGLGNNDQQPLKISLICMVVYSIICLYYLTAYFSFDNNVFRHYTSVLSPETLYQYQAQGLLSGHLYLPIPVPTEAIRELLSHKASFTDHQFATFLYSFMASPIGQITDASFYHDRLYLYFSIVPVLLFYLPFKILTGLYPSDSLVNFLFLSIALIANVLLLVKIKRQYFPKVTESNLVLTIMIMGITNGAPLFLKLSTIHEVVITSAFCCMSLCLLFLYHF